MAKRRFRTELALRRVEQGVQRLRRVAAGPKYELGLAIPESSAMRGQEVCWRG